MKFLRGFLGFVLLCLACCEGINPSSVGGSTEGGFPGQLVGIWKFSHFGPSSISVPDGVDLQALGGSHMTTAKFSIEKDGKFSMMMLGQSGASQVVVFDDSPLYIKFGDRSQPESNALMYEKKTKCIVMPTSIDVDGRSGVLPTYFKRASFVGR